MQYYIVQCKGVENAEKKRAINYCCAVDGDRFSLAFIENKKAKKKFLFFALLT